MSNGRRSVERSSPAYQKEFVYDEFSWRKSSIENAIGEDHPTGVRLGERSSRYTLEEFGRSKVGGNLASGWLSGN